MPIYDYKCRSCEDIKEERLPIGAAEAELELKCECLPLPSITHDKVITGSPGIGQVPDAGGSPGR